MTPIMLRMLIIAISIRLNTAICHGLRIGRIQLFIVMLIGAFIRWIGVVTSKLRNNKVRMRGWTPTHLKMP